MAQVFHRSTNLISRLTVYGGFVFVLLLFFVPWLTDRSPYVTYEDVPVNQPVPFSHLHHVTILGLDCRYCHTTVERSSFAGMPATETCMTCHSQIWHDSEMLAPVRESLRTGQSIEWNRVDKLPDFVYFDHSIHIAKGVGCTTCHGPIGSMPLTWTVASLKMSWCLNCHRQPEKYLRPRDQVFNAFYQPPPNQEQLGMKLAKEYHVQSLTDCVTCHR
jgi:Cytochrome c7 and related cytochrome c/Class III cytochrome C family